MGKTQVFIIHGGMTFKNKKDYLDYLKNRDVSIEKKFVGMKSILINH